MQSRHAHTCTVYMNTCMHTHSGHDWRLKILFFPFKILNGTAVDFYLFIYWMKVGYFSTFIYVLFRLTLLKVAGTSLLLLCVCSAHSIEILGSVFLLLHRSYLPCSTCVWTRNLIYLHFHFVPKECSKHSQLQMYTRM